MVRVINTYAILTIRLLNSGGRYEKAELLGVHAM
jgi:hypothetical protein